MRACCLLLIVGLAGATARAQTPVRQALPLPDVPGFKTLKANFHLHTVFSDGNVWPTVHVQEAWRDGLDVIALTEHAEYSTCGTFPQFRCTSSSAAHRSG
jgi:hypothetical protein